MQLDYKVAVGQIKMQVLIAILVRSETIVDVTDKLIYVIGDMDCDMSPKLKLAEEEANFVI